MNGGSKCQLAVWLVAAHLVVSLAHGLAHVMLAIPATAADDAFRILVIGLAPIVALPMLRHPATQRLGAGALTGSLGAAWLYGVVNHFVVAGDDHVILPATTGWGWVFAMTASLLFVLEAGGALLGAMLLRTALQPPQRAT
jgi:hypothetical protein